MIKTYSVLHLGTKNFGVRDKICQRIPLNTSNVSKSINIKTMQRSNITNLY